MKKFVVTIVHNPGGIQGDNFSYTHEYAYFVFPQGGKYIATCLEEMMLSRHPCETGAVMNQNEIRKKLFLSNHSKR